MPLNDQIITDGFQIRFLYYFVSGFQKITYVVYFSGRFSKFRVPHSNEDFCNFGGFGGGAVKANKMNRLILFKVTSWSSLCEFLTQFNAQNGREQKHILLNNFKLLCFLLRAFDCQTAVFIILFHPLKTAVWQSKVRNKK